MLRLVGQHHPQRDLVGRVGKDVAGVPHRGGCVVQRVDQRAAEDERPDVVQAVLERDDDAEIARAAAQAPEEVGVLGRRRGDEPAVGGDQIDREQIVDREAVLARQPARPRRRGQAGDARVRDLAAAGPARPCACVSRSTSPPERPGLRPRRPRLRVDPHSLHPRKVEDDPAVRESRTPARGVATPPRTASSVPVSRAQSTTADHVGPARLHPRESRTGPPSNIPFQYRAPRRSAADPP